MYVILYIQKKLERFTESAKKEQRQQTDMGKKFLSSSTSHRHSSDSKSLTSTSKIMESKDTRSTEELLPYKYKAEQDIKKHHSQPTVIKHPEG